MKVSGCLEQAKSRYQVNQGVQQGKVHDIAISKGVDEAAKAKERKAIINFIQNNGQVQVDERVRFYERISVHTTLFTPRGVSFFHYSTQIPLF